MTVMKQPLNTLRQLALLVAMILFMSMNAQELEWKNISGAVASSNTITKTADGTDYNAGASSANVLQPGADGYVEFPVIQTGKKFAFGFSRVDKDVDIKTIEYALELNTDNTLKIYFSGVFQGNFGTYRTGDVLKIERHGNLLIFYNNNVQLKKITLLYNTNPFIVDLSIGTASYEIRDGKVSFIKPLTMEPVITDYNTISNTPGNVDLNISGGSNNNKIFWKSPYTSEEIQLTEPVISDLAIGTYTASVFDDDGPSLQQGITVYQKLSWKDSTGVILTDSNLVKSAGTDNWENAGAYSAEILTAQETGLLTHRITSLTNTYAIGLHDQSLVRSGFHYNTMEYSVVVSNKKLLIYKKNLLQLKLGTRLSIGDDITIQKKEDSLVIYYNGMPIFKRALANPFGVCAQVALYKAGRELKNSRTTFFRPLRISSSQQDVNCVSNTKGSLTVNAFGGVAPYNYSFNESEFTGTNVFQNINAGTYTVIVRDNAAHEVQQTISISNCPKWVTPTTGASVNTKGDVVKNAGADSWENSRVMTAEPFVFTDTPSWMSFKTPDTSSVFLVGFRSLETEPTAQATNYKIFIKNGLATVIETDKDGFYNKRDITRVTPGMEFKVQLTKTGIEYYTRTTATTTYELIYTSTLFSNAKLIIESTLYKQGSKMEGIRVSGYGNVLPQ